MGLFDSLPTLGEIQGLRRAVPKYAEQTRLQVKAAKTRDERVEEAAWRRAVMARDGWCCRWCKRKVRITLELVPERGECHHVVPRGHRPTRWDPRAAVLLCLACHQRLTGTVGGERFIVVASKVFTLDGVDYADCSRAVRFKRVV